MAQVSGKALKKPPVRLPFGIHYSWVIVAVLATVQVFGSSIFMIAGVMVPPLTDPDGGFRWGIGELSVAIGLYYVFSAIFAPITGHLGDKFGARPMMLVGAVMYGVGMVALGFVSELWHFFLFYSFLMSFTASITMVPLMASISGWFRRRLGWGVGILWATGGIGTAILAPVIAYMLDTIGWQSAFTIVGLAGASAAAACTSRTGVTGCATATTARYDKDVERLVTCPCRNHEVA